MDKTTSAGTPKSGVKSFQCPSCGGQIALRVPGQSLMAVCNHCSSVIDVANENYQIIIKANEKERATLLPLGTKGSLFDTVWEVIGYTQKSDSSGDYLWDEYLLFNPYSGYRFLVEAQGHWSFIEMVKDEIPSSSVGALDYWSGDRQYKKFLADTSKVIYVKGEFYWRMKAGDKVQTVDYVSPPYLLSVERSLKEEVVSKGVYIEPAVIQKAFDIGLFKMPRRKGVGANQPSPYQDKLFKIWGGFALFLVLTIFCQMFTVGRSDKQSLHRYSYTYNGSVKGKTFSSPVFTISKKSNVLINTASSVDNDWVAIEYSLVKESSDAGSGTVEPQPDTPVRSEPTWVFCANEGGLCSFTGTRRVRYGYSNELATGTFSEGTVCNDTVFGNPAFGVGKSCWYEDIPSSQSTSGVANAMLASPAKNSQQSYNILVSVEYYHGYDSDGSWREGRQTSSNYIAASVPPGNYRLLYDIDSGPFTKLGNAGQVQLGYEIIRDVPSMGNFLWTIFLLLVFPAYASIRHSSFEGKRWSQSDFGPS